MSAACRTYADAEACSWREWESPAGPDRAVHNRQMAALCLQAALSTDDAALRALLRRRAAALISAGYCFR